MKQKIISNPKIAQPSLLKVFLRKRLFRLIDLNRAKPVVWVAAPGGSGKTTLIASYIQTRRLPCLWYQIDKGDADIASFFYYMGMAAQAASHRKQKPLPFLTPEYLSDITTFTKRYFEKLFAMLNPPSPPFRKGGKGEFVIVFDNYQDAPSDSMLHEVIREGLSLIPDKINVIIISRSEPLQELSRLRVSERLGLIRWNDIRFTFEESKKVARMKERKFLPDKLIEQIHKKTEGWIAGLILALEDLKTRDIDTQALEKVAQDEIFDYFASEIFERAGADVQQLLLKTAFLPKMTIPMVERLTGLGMAEQTLSYLNKNQYFIANRFQTEPVYEYHQLFRGFLLNRAKRMLSAEELSHIQRRAAEILEESGSAEDAAVLLSNIQDWEGLTKLIISNAQALIKQGRSKTVEEWLNIIPEDVLHHQPWLLFYKGVCQLSYNLLESRRFFKMAFDLFRQKNDRTGIFLSWSGMMDTYFHECEFVSMGDSIDLLEEILKQDNSFPSLEIEESISMHIFVALGFNRPEHPDIAMFEERVLSFMQKSQDISLYTMAGMALIAYNGWMGNFNRALLVCDILKGLAHYKDCPDLLLILAKTAEALHGFFTGLLEGSCEALSEGLQRSEKSGVHVWENQIYEEWIAIALNEGDMKTADDLLQKMQPRLNKARRFDIGYYHFVSAWNAFLKGDILSALEHQKICMVIFEKIGYKLSYSVINLNMALIMHKKGDDKEAEACLSKAHKFADEIKSRVSKFGCHLIEAYIALNKGDEEAALNVLRKALPIGRENGYMNIQWWIPSIMSQLCAIALEHNIEVEYIKNLIRTRNLNPPLPTFLPFEKGGSGGICVDAWPYPLKIHTLGRFEIFKDNKRIEQGRKAQKRPMDLLKMIIALGSRDVQDGQIIDALWPDTEGDAAWRAFATTLHRLRKLIENDKAILWRDGIITIDRQYCYVDAWAFQEHIKMADEAIQSGRQKQAVNLLEKAVGLYRGLFLSGDEKLPPAASFGAKLKNKFVRAIGGLGQAYEDMGEFEKAIDAYNKGIAVDELDEGFCQRLMLCYKRMGLRSEAIKAYNQFKTILFHSLQIGPSPETQAIYKSLIS